MIRESLLSEITIAISRVRDLVKDLSPMEREWLTDNSRIYHQLVIACRTTDIEHLQAKLAASDKTIEELKDRVTHLQKRLGRSL